MYEKILLDSANLEEIKKAFEYFPLEGVTTNPSLMGKSNVKDVIKHYYDIKKIIGDDKCLHIQVTQNNANDIVKQAISIQKEFGKNTFVKIPSTREGIKAMKDLQGYDVNITATLIYTPSQGTLAAFSGAKNLAIYYNRIEANFMDPVKTINTLNRIIDDNDLDCGILAASFKSPLQVMDAYANGVQCCTLPYSVLESCISSALFDDAEGNFIKDWKNGNLPIDWI